MASGVAIPQLAPPRSLTGLPGPVWGIDPSTLRIALAALEPLPWGVDVRWDVLSLSRSAGARRLSEALDLMQPWFERQAAMRPPSMVWVEQPFAAAQHVHPSSYFMVGIVLTALHRALPEALLIDTVPPPVWKRLALGEGNGGARKPQIMAWAQGAGYTGRLQDEADAIGIATALGVKADNLKAAA